MNTPHISLKKIKSPLIKRSLKKSRPRKICPTRMLAQTTCTSVPRVFSLSRHASMCASTRRRINVVTAERNDDDDTTTKRIGYAETSSSNEHSSPETMMSSPTRRRMILLASTTAAGRMAFANGSSFGAKSSEWATLNDGSAPGLASPPPSKGQTQS